MVWSDSIHPARQWSILLKWRFGNIHICSCTGNISRMLFDNFLVSSWRFRSACLHGKSISNLLFIILIIILGKKITLIKRPFLRNKFIQKQIYSDQAEKSLYVKQERLSTNGKHTAQWYKIRVYEQLPRCTAISKYGFNRSCGVFCSMLSLTRPMWKHSIQRQPVCKNVLSPLSRKLTLFQKVLKKPKKRWGKLFPLTQKSNFLFFSGWNKRVVNFLFSFRDFAKSINRPFSVYFNPYTQSIEILKDTRSIENVVQDLRSDLNTVCDALSKMNRYLGIWYVWHCDFPWAAFSVASLVTSREMANFSNPSIFPLQLGLWLASLCNSV